MSEKELCIVIGCGARGHRPKTLCLSCEPAWEQARAALARELLEEIDLHLLHLGAEQTIRSLKGGLREIAEEGK